MDQAGLPTQWVYEITFIGKVHNTEITLEPNPDNPTKWNQLQIVTGGQTVTAPPPVFVEEPKPDEGTSEHDASIAMTPDGSYVIVYTQDNTNSIVYTHDNTNSTRSVTTKTIQYSVTQATTDTAGPTVADVMVLRMRPSNPQRV